MTDITEYSNVALIAELTSPDRSLSPAEFTALGNYLLRHRSQLEASQFHFYADNFNEQSALRAIEEHFSRFFLRANADYGDTENRLQKCHVNITGIIRPLLRAEV